MPNKTPDDYQSPIALRPDAWLQSELTERSTEKQSTGQVAKRDLSRLYMLYRLALPKFNREEALLLVETYHTIELKPQTVHMFADFIRATHTVDEVLDAEFLARLDGLHFFECMAIVDAIERFWSADSFRSVDVRLKECGLIA